MTFAPENLGLQSTGLALLRDLIHEHTGSVLRRRAASTCWPIDSRRWCSSAASDSFLDYYYLLKYDERQRRRVARG